MVFHMGSLGAHVRESRSMLALIWALETCVICTLGKAGKHSLGSFVALVIPGEIKVSTSSHQVNNRNKLY